MLLSEQDKNCIGKRISEIKPCSEQTAILHDMYVQFHPLSDSTLGPESTAADSAFPCTNVSAFALTKQDSKSGLVKYLLAKGGRLDSEIRWATSIHT